VLLEFVVRVAQGLSSVVLPVGEPVMRLVVQREHGRAPRLEERSGPWLMV